MMLSEQNEETDGKEQAPKEELLGPCWAPALQCLCFSRAVIVLPGLGPPHTHTHTKEDN